MRVLDTRPESVPTADEYQAGSATQRQLSVAVGYANHGGANLQYGLFAGKLAETMGVEVDGDLVYLLSTFRRDADVADGEVQLVMRPEVRAALDSLGWFADEVEGIAEQ